MSEPERTEGIFYSVDRDFSRETHAVIVGDVERTDYELQLDEGRSRVVFAALTRDELINVQIIRRPKPPEKSGT